MRWECTRRGRRRHFEVAVDRNEEHQRQLVANRLAFIDAAAITRDLLRPGRTGADRRLAIPQGDAAAGQAFEILEQPDLAAKLERLAHRARLKCEDWHFIDDDDKHTF